ncbi:U7 snRNA-associated Sm-like protein LSm11 [Gryllus bimaculatus]|nr:U7 snRNA-associated Sm-like protein LSm11 [Gryllus bimaculatus]
MSDSDESLDLKSEKFDPIKALYSANVSVPCTSAQVYDNVSKFSSAVLRGVQTKPSEKKKKVPEPPAPQIQRKFLPHQMPVSRPAPARTQRTVLTRMREEVPQGPLALLATCAQRRLRVKVYTRHASGVRGYAEAFVAAFDKHWNLALEDVREVWVRRRRPPVPPLVLLFKIYYFSNRFIVAHRNGSLVPSQIVVAHNKRPANRVSVGVSPVAKFFVSGIRCDKRGRRGAAARLLRLLWDRLIFFNPNSRAEEFLRISSKP